MPFLYTISMYAFLYEIHFLNLHRGFHVLFIKLNYESFNNKMMGEDWCEMRASFASLYVSTRKACVCVSDMRETN